MHMRRSSSGCLPEPSFRYGIPRMPKRAAPSRGCWGCWHMYLREFVENELRIREHNASASGGGKT
jgi:hypothetical protein